jgi:hypothetical protein
MASKPELKPKPQPKEDPFDIAGAEDRSADHFEKLMAGKAADSKYWKGGDQ